MGCKDGIFRDYRPALGDGGDGEKRGVCQDVRGVRDDVSGVCALDFGGDLDSGVQRRRAVSFGGGGDAREDDGRVAGLIWGADEGEGGVGFGLRGAG